MAELRLFLYFCKSHIITYHTPFALEPHCPSLEDMDIPNAIDITFFTNYANPINPHFPQNASLEALQTY
jgi:hypothetical protein